MYKIEHHESESFNHDESLGHMFEFLLRQHMEKAITDGKHINITIADSDGKVHDTYSIWDAGEVTKL